MNGSGFFNKTSRSYFSTSDKSTRGLALTRNKPGLGLPGIPIEQVSVPAQLLLPLLDYKKRTVKPYVTVGDRVRPGDWLAQGVLATAGGVVSAIESSPLIHPSNLLAPCVTIDVDRHSDGDVTITPLPASLVERIARANVAGLGGAGFSTADKLSATSNASAQISTLLVNAVECEPIISCDEALIHSNPTAIINAIAQMITHTACTQCVLAIEDDKLDAIQALRTAIKNHERVNKDEPAIDLVLLSPVYPSGAERVLIQRITGQYLSADTRASDIGILCLNVATVLAASRAQQGHPLLSRVVTVAGGAAARATNVRVTLGTPVQHVLRHTGNEFVADFVNETTFSKHYLVRAGGPLSGFELHNLNAPITATTNCLTIDRRISKEPASPCIRCSQCSNVCPVGLLPQQLFWHTDKADVGKATRFGLSECIECGCCDIVCPSAIDLTASFRHAKSLWREQQTMSLEAELARQRFEQREKRLVERQLHAARLREEKAAQLQHASDKQDPIAAAMARARARKRRK